MIDGSVCIIGVYFGTLPEMFPIWVKSCTWNPTIDFLLITDQPVLNFPNNLHVIHSTLENFKQSAEKKLGFKISLERPYKLCDFRPAYGYLLQEYISEYEYWGLCDLDTVWGDIRTFIEKYEYRKYDKFLPMGHLMLYRNSQECNMRFMLDGSMVGNYMKVFTSSNSMLFDEVMGIGAIYRKHGFSEFTENIYADISCMHCRMKLRVKPPINNSIYDKYFPTKESNEDHQLFAWKKGKIYRLYWRAGTKSQEEYIYIHLQKRSMKNFVDEEASEFLIIPNCFINFNLDNVREEDAKKYNAYKGILFEQIERLVYELQCKVKNLLKGNQRIVHIRRSSIQMNRSQQHLSDK